MLQRTTISSTMSNNVTGAMPSPSLGWGRELTTRLWNSPVGVLIRILSMPLDRTALLWWGLILSLFSAGAGMHIWMSIQIAQSERSLIQLEQEHAKIELVNAEFMWQISEYTNLTSVQKRAEGLGFRLNFENRYMPLASNLGPVDMSTKPMVDALPMSPQNQAAQGNPSNESMGSRMTFERLNISFQGGEWLPDLRRRSGELFQDLNLGLDLLWQDLRFYGGQTWQRMAGEFLPPETIIAATE